MLTIKNTPLLKKGLKIYLKPINNQARYSKEVKEATVIYIGRKYFYAQIDMGQKVKFDINTMLHSSYYSPNFKAYYTIEEIESEIKSRNIYSKISKFFDGYGNIPDLDTLEKIAELLKICH